MDICYHCFLEEIDFVLLVLVLQQIFSVELVISLHLEQWESQVELFQQLDLNQERLVLV